MPYFSASLPPLDESFIAPIAEGASGPQYGIVALKTVAFSFPVVEWTIHFRNGGAADASGNVVSKLRCNAPPTWHDDNDRIVRPPYRYFTRR